MDGLHGDDTSLFEDAGLSRVVAECDRFEAMWRAGERPRIEDSLERVAPPLRARLLRELLAIEIELRAERGESPAPDDYLARCPDWAAAVADVFSRQTFESQPTEQPPDLTAPPSGHDDLGSDDSGPPGAGGNAGETLEDLHGVAAAMRPADPLPERFGRYTALALLGRGTFGSVYLARDEELGRLVAIKVLHRGVLRNPGQVESFLAEARMAGGLVHPGIVRVYDVGHFDDGEVFVVFEYVEGHDLAGLLRAGRPAPATVAGLLAQIAEAAHHAHEAGLVHRDLKPSNILVDWQGAPHIADFGLAVREDAQHLMAGEIAGTPAFMAPEQIRGETHRLDGRTDVWALGVILYQALTGQRPFRGRNRGRIFRKILAVDPRPPGQLVDSIPRELERICLKCLAKRMTDRYETAAELADDLNRWLGLEGAARPGVVRSPAWPPAPAPASAQAPIVPKGLRAFDLEDADFFLRLVPGPRDRDGVPESIRAWRCRIEEPDPARSFPVGLIYGPSGGGKTSLVKAGLIPRLPRWVRTIYLEAAALGTEARLLAALSREFPGLPADCGLPEAAAAIREGRAARGGSKVLVVLDQFEQWLHGHPDDEDGDLVRALRQCDGSGLQALLLVRDDFWMAITRFLRVLEVRPIEGENSAAVEPFDARHAGRVLAELGRALGRLHDPAGPEETRFLEHAVKELAGPDGRVIPVRLTLLAEMLRHRDWTTATLRERGGFEGIGRMFLEETFSAPAAPPAHRAHQHAARAVLKALLPEPCSDLKGRMQPASALREAAGYADRPAEFAELMALLDNELRMVTPVPGGVEGDGWRVEGEETGPGTKTADRSGDPASVESTPATRYYQLTHDYLVPPVRQWLTQKKGETLRGRAELRLAAVTALWRERPERRRLPSLLEWVTIVGLTKPAGWSEDERRMMRAAMRHYLLRAAAAVLIASASAWAFVAYRARERADRLLGQALGARYPDVPNYFDELQAYRDDHRAELLVLETDESASEHRREVASMLLYLDQATPSRGAALRDRLTSAEAQPDEVAAIRIVLAAHRAEAGIDELRRLLRDEAAEPAARLRAGCALQSLEPGFAGGPDATAAAPAMAEALLAEHRRAFPRWLELLGPVAAGLVPALSEIRRDPGRESYDQAAAAEVLAGVLGHGDRDVELMRAITEATPMAARVLLREFESRKPSPEALEFLRAALRGAAGDFRDEVRKDERAARRAAAATALAALGEPDRLWPLLLHRPDPRLRSLLIQRLAADTVPAHLLVERLALSNLDPIEYQALLLAWAEAIRTAVPAATRAAVADRARYLYLHHPHPGVHAAAGLLLRRWEGAESLKLVDKRLPDRNVPGGWGWERRPDGQTFAIVPAGPVFRMGSPEQELGHRPDQAPHHRKIGRALAVSMTEVTIEQIRAFDKCHPQAMTYAGEPGCAADCVNWFQAVRYCNWLSALSGIDPSRWCYPEPTAAGVLVPGDAVDKEGFRLPTEAEWEYLCRADTETARYYGESPDLLRQYSWTWLNSDDRVHPVGQRLPNEWGMFDMLGNVWEWCHDGPAGAYPDFPMPCYPQGTLEHPATDPADRRDFLVRGGVNETWRLLRGGCFNYSPSKARSAHRDWIGAQQRVAYIGFRVVRTLPPMPGANVRPEVAVRRVVDDDAARVPRGR